MALTIIIVTWIRQFSEDINVVNVSCIAVVKRTRGKMYGAKERIKEHFKTEKLYKEVYI